MSDNVVWTRPPHSFVTFADTPIQPPTRQDRMVELAARWGADPTQWFPATSAWPSTPIDQWSCRLVESLHKLSQRTLTAHDRDTVVTRIAVQVAQRAAIARMRIPGDAHACDDDVHPDDIDRVHHGLDSALSALRQLAVSWGADAARWLPAGGAPAPSPLDWNSTFLRHLALFAAGHPGARRAMVDRFFPEAVRARRRLNPRAVGGIVPADIDVAEMLFNEALEKGCSVEDYQSSSSSSSSSEEEEEEEMQEKQTSEEEESDGEEENGDGEENGGAKESEEEGESESEEEIAQEAETSGHKRKVSETSSPATPPRPQKRQETEAEENQKLRERIKELEKELADARGRIEELKGIRKGKE